jgi:uncharacterized membrane protein
LIKKVRAKIRNTFLAGLLVLIPTAITIYSFYFVFSKLNSLLTLDRLTWIVNLFGLELPPSFNIPFFSLITTIVMILLVGLITTSYGGRKVVTSLEKVLEKVPLFRTIYQASKNIMEALANPEKNSFRQVVLLEYPRKGIYAVGFVTSDTPKGIDDLKSDERLVNVFVPTAPNPTSGFLVILPKKDVIPLDISTEEGFRLIISAGTISPDNIRVLAHRLNGEETRDPTVGKVE